METTCWRFNQLRESRIREASVTDGSLGPVETVPEKYENGGFTLKTVQMFSVHSRKRINGRTSKKNVEVRPNKEQVLGKPPQKMSTFRGRATRWNYW